MARRSVLGLTTRTQRLRSVLREGLAATVTCDGSCAVQARLVLPARLAKRYGLGNGRQDFVVATGTASPISGRPARVLVRLSAKARRALAHARSLRLRIEVSSPDATTVVRTVTCRR